MRRLRSKLEAREIALDGDFESRDLPAVLVDEDDVGFPLGLADQVGTRRGLQHGVDLRRVGHHDLAHLARQLDDHRLVQAQSVIWRADAPPLSAMRK